MDSTDVEWWAICCRDYSWFKLFFWKHKPPAVENESKLYVLDNQKRIKPFYIYTELRVRVELSNNSLKTPPLTLHFVIQSTDYFNPINLLNGRNTLE